MFLNNRENQWLALIYMAMIIAIAVANSQELIYSNAGCWPAYGDRIIHYGLMAMYALFPALSISIAHARKWVKTENGMPRNIIGYAGAFSAGLFLTVLTIAVIGMYVGPSFEHRFGYVACQ